MAKFERNMNVSAGVIAAYLDDGIRASGMSVELVDSSVTRMGDISVWLFVYDKYYMRTSSRAALSVQIVGNGECSNITAIAAGGGTGSFLSFSYGAEENFVSVVEQLLSEYSRSRM